MCIRDRDRTLRKSVFLLNLPEGRMYKGMTGIVLYFKDCACRVKNTPIVSFNPFSSLSSFPATNSACRPVDGHPWGGATDYHATQIAKKVKTLRFSRRAWPSLFVPLRVEQLNDTQDHCTVKCSSCLSLHPRHTDCLLYTSDAADDLLCVDLGGRRIIKKKKKIKK